MANFRVDYVGKDGTEYHLIRELDCNNKRDVNEAYRNGRNLDQFRRVGKYRDRLGFIYYFYI